MKRRHDEEFEHSLDDLERRPKKLRLYDLVRRPKEELNLDLKTLLRLQKQEPSFGQEQD